MASGAFLQWIKQHLRIKAFFGTSENAVNIHIWVAIRRLYLRHHRQETARVGGFSLHNPTDFELGVFQENADRSNG